jgi:hypothetical protein
VEFDRRRVGLPMSPRKYGQAQSEF